MPHYTAKWSMTEEKTKEKTYHYNEFFVGDDPDPPGKWVVWYRFFYMGGETDYWVKLPKTNRAGAGQYMRRAEVLNRDLTCTAPGGRCKRLCLYKFEDEPRLHSLTHLAYQIEHSRALLDGRPVRKFESIDLSI